MITNQCDTNSATKCRASKIQTHITEMSVLPLFLDRKKLVSDSVFQSITQLLESVFSPPMDKTAFQAWGKVHANPKAVPGKLQDDKLLTCCWDCIVTSEVQTCKQRTDSTVHFWMTHCATHCMILWHCDKDTIVIRHHRYDLKQNSATQTSKDVRRLKMV